MSNNPLLIRYEVIDLFSRLLCNNCLPIRVLLCNNDQLAVCYLLLIISYPTTLYETSRLQAVCCCCTHHWSIAPLHPNRQEHVCSYTWKMYIFFKTKSSFSFSRFTQSAICTAIQHTISIGTINTERHIMLLSVRCKLVELWTMTALPSAHDKPPSKPLSCPGRD